MNQCPDWGRKQPAAPHSHKRNTRPCTPAAKAVPLKRCRNATGFHFMLYVKTPPREQKCMHGNLYAAPHAGIFIAWQASQIFRRNTGGRERGDGFIGIGCEGVDGFADARNPALLRP